MLPAVTNPTDDDALIWRLPRWQPALLFLVTAGLAGYALYGPRGSAIVLSLVIVLAVAFFVAAVAAARMYLVADEDGVGVRRYAGESSLVWEQISGIAVAKQRGGSLTLEIQTPDRLSVTVPPSLVLPLRPTSIPRTSNLLTRKAQELNERRPEGKPAPLARE